MHIFLKRLKIQLFMTQFSITKPSNNEALKSIRAVKIKINQRPTNKQKVINCKVTGHKGPTATQRRGWDGFQAQLRRGRTMPVSTIPFLLRGAELSTQLNLGIPRSPADHAQDPALGPSASSRTQPCQRRHLLTSEILATQLQSVFQSRCIPK